MTRVAPEAVRVPLLDLWDVHGSLREELLHDFERVLRSGQFILGPELDGFEAELAAWSGVRHAVGLASGTAALSLALQALGVGPGDEVVVPAFTYIASATSVTGIGAKPVFVDVEPDRMGLDPGRLADSVSVRTKAVMVVHLYGLSAALGPVLEVASRSGIPVLEDAAQAVGASDAGFPVGTRSAGAALSFFPTKNLGALGDAGAFLTDDDARAQRVRLLRVHGDAGGYRHTALGTNARLDALQAAFLRTKLRHLRGWIQERRRLAARYRSALAGTPVGLPTEPIDAPHTYHQFTVRAPERDALQRHLAEQGIAARVYYPIPLPVQPCFASLGHREGDFPVSERLAREVLSLPLFPGIGDARVDRVAEVVRGFYLGPGA